MKEILITSSVLILAILAIRQIFKGVLSRRFQYALWALVLVRLLMPVSLPAAEFSVMTAAQPVEQVVTARLDRIAFTPARPETVQTPGTPSGVSPALDHAAPEGPLPQVVGPGAAPDLKPAPRMTAGEVMALIWKVGMALMGGFFLVSNLAFYLKLRKNRQEWRAGGDIGPFPVRKIYLVPEGVIPSPCLFGRSIYITPAVAEDPARLRHVLTHEATHAKHLDPVWSLLRCVCLTIYWFDPLVWVAAACSRADCELACDESALKALGETERIGYGQTLLSLIPVKRVGNPMLAATTMTAGKKQLTDRITRIAKNPRQWVAAALTVALLSGMLAACTFTGAKESPGGLRPLTGKELQWFNLEFFNRNENPAISYTYTIRNQFANPINLYEKPEDIDLHELLYLEGSAPTDEELQAVLDTTSGDLPCPAYKLTAREIDDILTQYTGLTLDTANRESLTYTYDETTDAYYWMHGDTNYPGELEFLYGTREGDTVKLYHNSGFAGGGWYCVTLEAQGDEGYHFLSNVECQHPAIPAPMPAGEPAATISLADMPQYIAPGDGVESSPGSAPDREEYLLARYPIGEDGILLYRDPQDDQTVYAALARSDGSLEVFLTTRDPNTQALPIDRLFDQGKEAHLLALGYWESEGQPRWPTWDFYAFWDGRPALLCRSTGCGGVQPQILDLDGDGTVELITQEELFFLRDGTLRRAELKELVMAACPELDSFDLVASEDGSCFRVYGYTETFKTATRSVYFDGENLLVYKDEKPTEDHMVMGADEGVPALVVEKARDYAKTVYEGKIEKTSDPVPTDGGTSYLWGDPASYDDWRVKSFHGPYTFDIAGVNIIAWGFNHELHTTTPENVVLAGGMYITEDDWVCTGYSNTDYVFCIQNDQGDLTFGWYDWYQEGMESYYVHNSVLHAMQEHGVIPNDGSTYAGLQFKSDLDYLLDHSGNQLRVQYDDNQGGGGTYLVNPAEGNGSFYRNQLTDPSNYIWGSFGEGEDWYAPDCPSVTLSQPDWNMLIQFWLYDNVVMVKYSNREPIWYGAQSTFDPMDPFYLRSTAYYQARCWFDDAQYEALAAELPPIPDEGEGQSYLNIAQAWAQGHEGIKVRLSPGGSSTCSFVKVTGVGTLEDMPERWFPADILDYPHFAFTYDVAFVPENEDALITLMAGNTGNYEGGDPTVPQGAYTYNRRGSMYLKDGYWYCAGVGTG